MKINKKAVKSNWFDFNEKVKFNLKPFPFSSVKLSDVDATLWAQFDFCVIDWKGLEDDEGKALKCDEENKRFIFDYVPELREFIFTSVRTYNEKINGEIKNS